ncbi:MAG: DUF3291 domain-containing protein [Alphaproteobacteria bacterium]|nr:MAG: DUF3291 domain-containing protein [Alphaproteobacteria bacterium]
MTALHLAQLNIGRLRHEAADPRMAEFIDNLALVNGLAERSPGFVWRYLDDSGSAIETRPFAGDPRMAINLSVWDGVEALERFVWQTVHKRFYGRRHEWFERMNERYFVMWWVTAGHRPTVQEAIERLGHLQQHGPSDYAFGWETLPAARLWKAARCA